MTKDEQWRKAIRAELNRNERTDIGSIQKAIAKEPDCTKEQIEAAHDFVSVEFWKLCLTALNKGFLDDYSATDEILKIEDMLANLLAKREAQAHAAGVREGIEKATTPTDAMKAHFEGDNEIYQTFEIDGETHILPLRFATVRYVLDEIRALIKG